MLATTKPLLDQTARDLMSYDLVRLTEEMSLQEAARLLSHEQVSGAPVVDTQGRCVGVLSATDFVRLAVKRDDFIKPSYPARPITCSFQRKRRIPAGDDLTLCTLAPGACVIQVKKKGPRGEEMIICSQPHCVLADWQAVEVEKLPADAVGHHMTAEAVTVPPDTPIRELARLMIDAHIHRIIVVDEQAQPLGIVSSSDILAALAYAGQDQ